MTYTIEELKNEVLTRLKQFDESNLIDDIFLTNWIKDGLKQFGGSLMQEQETILDVENGKAKLPDNFYSLRYALKCEGYGYSIDNTKKDILFAQPFYQKRIKKTGVWDNQVDPPCFKGYECEFIREDSIFLDRDQQQHTVSFWYGSPMRLKLVRGYTKLKCDKGCKNLTIDSPYHISVQNNNYLNCNFQTGNIYLRFKGLPEDEEGEIIIPETSRNKLKEYLEYTCIRRTLENIWLNDDKPDVVTKYNTFRQLEDQAYLAAKNDIIDQGLFGWEEKVKRQLRRRTRKFELMYSPI